MSFNSTRYSFYRLLLIHVSLYVPLICAFYQSFDQVCSSKTCSIFFAPVVFSSSPSFRINTVCTKDFQLSPRVVAANHKYKIIDVRIQVSCFFRCLVNTYPTSLNTEIYETEKLQKSWSNLKSSHSSFHFVVVNSYKAMSRV